MFLVCTSIRPSEVDDVALTVAVVVRKTYFLDDDCGQMRRQRAQVGWR